MRNTRKILVALLVLMTILMSLVVVAIPASAAAQPEKLYLTPSSNWKQSNARFAAYFFGNGETWVSMTDANKDGVYEVDVPTDKVYPSVIFCRMNPSAAANNWNNKWNQTADLTIPTSGANHYTVKEGTWDNGGGTWSTFGSTCAHANLGPAATCTTAQVCQDCGDPVVSELGHTYNSAHLCTRCNEQATFTVAGSGAHLGVEWDTGNTANDMTYADGVYTKVYENVAAGSYELKCVRDHAWGTAYPQNSDNSNYKYTVATAGSTVTVTLKGTTVNVTVEAPHTCSFSDATCTEPAKCECGKTQGEALGHDYVEGVCSRCEAADPDYVPTCKHVLEQNVFYHPELVAATCCTTGVEIWECTVEGCDYYEKREAPIDPEAHGFWGDREVITEANCATKTNGLVKVACDNGCGQFNEVVIEYTEAHDWDVQKDTPATCTTDGEYYAVCTICNEVDERAAEAQGHYNWYITCGQSGECMECGVEFTKEHNGDPATCTDPMYCYNCWSSVGEALGHDYVEGVCSRCEAEDPNYVPPAEKEEHTFTADLVAVPNADKDAIADGTIYADYFTVVGKVTVRWTESKGVYAIELDKKSNGALQFTVAGKSTITVSFASTGGSNLSLIGLVDADGNVIAPSEGVEEVTGTGFITVTYTVGEGTYKVVNPSSERNTRVESVVVAPAVEAPAHVNTLVVGETNKIVVSGNTLNAYQLPIEWVLFTADEAGYYSFVGDNGALAMIFSADGTALLCGGTGKANLEAGTYLVCLGNRLVGEFNVAVTKSAWVNTLAIGENKILITDALANDYGYYIVWVPFEVTEKANYTFGGEGILPLVFDAAYGAVEGTELEVGTYNICIAFLTPATTGVATVKVEKTAIGGETPVEPELPALQLGDNTVVIDGSETNLTGQAIAWLELVVTEAGTYKISSADLNCYICADKSFNNVLCSWTGVAELEPGTYYVAVGNAGITGTFTVTVETDVEAPAKNTIVVGENVYVLNNALKEVGYEWLYLTVDKDGIYTFSGLSTLTFFIWPDYPNEITVPETAAYVWNVDPITGDPMDSIEVELVAGTYLVGFRYNYAEAGEYNISVTHSEKIETPDDPETDTPNEPEQPAPELSLFEKIMQTINEFIAKITAWFKSFIAGLKK